MCWSRNHPASSCWPAPVGRRRGRSWSPATSWPRRWIICRSRWSRLPPISPPRAPASASRLHEAAAAELLARKALGSTEYPDAVITTWQATVAKLSPESRAVLRLCAWYADTPIPRALVMGGAKEVLALAAGFGPVMPLSGPAAAELRMRDALTGLARYSMILDATDATFRVHGLVQTVERVRAEQEGHDDEARDLALVRLSAVFPYAFKDPSAWPLCRQLLPHQRALTARLGTDHESAELARLLNTAGMFLTGSGDAAGALPLYHRALESRERVLGAEHPHTLHSVNNLAVCIEALGDAAGALPLKRRRWRAASAYSARSIRTHSTACTISRTACLRLATRPGPCRSTAGRWRAASACSARSIRTRSPA